MAIVLALWYSQWQPCLRKYAWEREGGENMNRNGKEGGGEEEKKRRERGVVNMTHVSHAGKGEEERRDAVELTLCGSLPL